jgi:hypothetical protein
MAPYVEGLFAILPSARNFIRLKRQFLGHGGCAHKGGLWNPILFFIFHPQLPVVRLTSLLHCGLLSMAATGPKHWGKLVVD